MLERDCGQDGIHDKRPGGLTVAHKLAQDVPMTLTRIEDSGGGL
jgi:hypothetical protein